MYTASEARRSLLLVTDDLMFPSRLREALRVLPYDLRVAATEAAAQAAAAAGPSAILVNLSARRIDALALISAFKADEATRAIPLLAFAGHVETAKHDAARSAGADMVAANSSVSLHLDRLLPRLLDGEHSADVSSDSA